MGMRASSLEHCFGKTTFRKSTTSGRRSLSAIYDAADGLKFIVGEMFEFAREKIADLLYRDARAAGDLAAAEIGYGDEPCDYAH